eukprot:4752965-Amphidinium_carterae.1
MQLTLPSEVAHLILVSYCRTSTVRSIARVSSVACTSIEFLAGVACCKFVEGIRGSCFCAGSACVPQAPALLFAPVAILPPSCDSGGSNHLSSADALRQFRSNAFFLTPSPKLLLPELSYPDFNTEVAHLLTI